MYSLVTTQRFDTHFQDILDYSNPRKYLHKDFERKIHSTRKTTAGGLSPFKGV